MLLDADAFEHESTAEQLLESVVIEDIQDEVASTYLSIVRQRRPEDDLPPNLYLPKELDNDFHLIQSVLQSSLYRNSSRIEDSF